VEHLPSPFLVRIAGDGTLHVTVLNKGFTAWGHRLKGTMRDLAPTGRGGRSTEDHLYPIPDLLHSSALGDFFPGLSWHREESGT
jgi:hypothetical protein